MTGHRAFHLVASVLLGLVLAAWAIQGAAFGDPREPCDVFAVIATVCLLLFAPLALAPWLLDAPKWAKVLDRISLVPGGAVCGALCVLAVVGFMHSSHEPTASALEWSRGVSAVVFVTGLGLHVAAIKRLEPTSRSPSAPSVSGSVEHG